MLLFLSTILVSTFIRHSCAAFLASYSSPQQIRIELSLHQLSKHDSYFSSCVECSSRTSITRDQFISTLTLLGVVTPLVANATGSEEEVQDSLDASKRTFVKGIVQLTAGEENLIPEEVSSSALYITARPQRPDNVPRAILDGSYGKPPPVLACRIPNPSFPYEFKLSTLDLTPEGAYFLDESSRDKYWFEGENLVVSARWDTDGVASTRDPTDLVGRSQYYSSLSGKEGESLVIVELSGRGITGKLVTGKNKKS